jgi:hypothetical protein
MTFGNHFGKKAYWLWVLNKLVLETKCFKRLEQINSDKIFTLILKLLQNLYFLGIILP